MKFAQIWQQDLKQLNVNLKIETISHQVWQERIRGTKFKQAWAQLFGSMLSNPALLFSQPRPFLPRGTRRTSRARNTPSSLTGFRTVTDPAQQEDAVLRRDQLTVE